MVSGTAYGPEFTGTRSPLRCGVHGLPAADVHRLLGNRGGGVGGYGYPGVVHAGDHLDAASQPRVDFGARPRMLSTSRVAASSRSGE